MRIVHSYHLPLLLFMVPLYHLTTSNETTAVTTRRLKLNYGCVLKLKLRFSAGEESFKTSQLPNFFILTLYNLVLSQLPIATRQVPCRSTQVVLHGVHVHAQCCLSTLPPGQFLQLLSQTSITANMRSFSIQLWVYFCIYIPLTSFWLYIYRFYCLREQGCRSLKIRITTPPVPKEFPVQQRGRYKALFRASLFTRYVNGRLENCGFIHNQDRNPAGRSMVVPICEAYIIIENETNILYGPC